VYLFYLSEAFTYGEVNMDNEEDKEQPGNHVVADAGADFAGENAIVQKVERAAGRVEQGNAGKNLEEHHEEGNAIGGHLQGIVFLFSWRFGGEQGIVLITAGIFFMSEVVTTKVLISRLGPQNSRMMRNIPAMMSTPAKKK
jgi:hypothetical protein